MRKKLAIGGIALFLVGVMILTVHNFESHPILQVLIVPPLVIGIFLGIIGLVAALIGVSTILLDYLFPKEK